MLSVIITGAGLALAAYLVFSPRLRSSAGWRATVEPLASIMGSGFLVCAPLLAGVVGDRALFYMAALLALAYVVGGAIRFNIRFFEPIEHKGHGPAHELAFASRLVLSAAYFVSVSYYLQLLAAFAVRPFGVHDPTVNHLIVTVLLLSIGGVGVWRGLDELEQVERFAVGLNLGVIGALVLGLMIHNGRLLWDGAWALPRLSTHTGFPQLRVVLGLLIVVQGFETSRYLGDEHPPEIRIRTMRNAQLISTAIYLVFIALATVLFQDGLGADVTAIIQMTAPVAVALPVLLGIAAIGSQFSASIADYASSGGLIEDLSERRLTIRYAYALALAVSMALTWGTDVTQIIAYASRAFALYYALQGAVAFAIAWDRRKLPRRSLHLAQYAFVVITCLAVFFLGAPAE